MSVAEDVSPRAAAEAAGRVAIRWVARALMEDWERHVSRERAENARAGERGEAA